MSGTLDVQRDHIDLVRSATRLLAADGLLIFSTNFTRFQLDGDTLSELQIEDISRATIPKDFERNAKIHRCYLIRRKENQG
jgi:23S rRNA (guanine2445-N2)-methyltransferase / 23S rRNA (guanine2069-N7)-methyltransferase